MSRPFYAAYISAEADAERFLPRAFSNRSDRIAITRAAAQRTIRPELVRLIAAFNGALPSSASRRHHLDALALGNVATVLTGQQIGLFLGPLYTLYKAATAIQLARALSAESQTPCVPIFWLQTEDHDFEEIDHCYVHSGASAPLRLQLSSESPQRISVKQRRVDGSISLILDTLRNRFTQLMYADETLDLLRECYQPGRALGDAFAHLVAAIFADEGLLCIDPREPRLSNLVAPLMREAIDSFRPISEALGSRGEALRAAGFDEQVPVRHNCTLAFFHHPDAAGPRFRLERTGDYWTLAGANTTISDEDLARALVSDPHRLSTSALLRPIIQDSLLPTAAYVGGPAEIGYFAQLPPLYAHFKIPMPMIVPRARFRLLDARSSEYLRRLGLNAHQIEDTREALLATVNGDAATRADGLRRDLLGPFLERLDAFDRATRPRDGSLEKGLKKTRMTVSKAVDRLSRRFVRMLTDRNESNLARVQYLQNLLFPDRMPQERYYSFVSFACRYGLAHLKKRLLDAADPFNPSIRDIEL